MPDLAGPGITAGARIWALVLHYRLGQETLRCVRSLLESDYPNLHILVIDNGSGNDSLADLCRFQTDQIDVLSLPENLFYAGGMNAGLAWALARGADWLLALNNDTFVSSDMITRLVEATRLWPDVGIVAPVIYYAADPERIWSAGAIRRRAWPFARELTRQGDLPTEGPGPYTVDYVTGCAMLLSRRALQAAGPFDPRYRMYYEDLDLCERIRGAGYRIMVAPQARMWHLVARTARAEPVTNRYHRTRNRWRYYLAHTQGFRRLGTALLLLFQEGLRGIGYSLHGQQALARAQWAALRDGVRNDDVASC